MSFEAMTWAVRKLLPCTQKCVLLMLANRINGDTGRCIPRIRTLAEDCGLKETAVRAAIKELVDKGLVTVHERRVEGVSLSNQYELHLWSTEHDRPLDPESPFVARQKASRTPPSPNEPPPRQTNHPPLRQTKGGGSPNEGGPSPNEGIEPVKETGTKPNTKGAARLEASSLELPGWIDRDTWFDFIDMRQRIKKPLTERAAVRLVNKLTKLRLDGEDIEAVLDQSIVNCWQDVFPVRQQKAAAGVANKASSSDDPSTWGMTTAAQRAAEAGMDAWNNVEASMGRMPDFDTYKRQIHQRLTQRHAA